MKTRIITTLIAGLSLSVLAHADQFGNWNGFVGGSQLNLANQQSVINANHNLTVDNDSRIHSSDLAVSNADYTASMGSVTTTGSVNDNFLNGANNNNGGLFTGTGNTYRIDVANVAQNSIAPVNAYSTNVAPVNAIQVADINTQHDNQFVIP